MKCAFFLGCVIPYRVLNYELSTRRVAQDLGIELVDVDGFACCGFPMRSVDVKATLLMAARNLCVAEEEGLDICTICPGCASVLTEANKELKENKELREEVNRELMNLNKKFQGRVKVRHFVRVLYEDIGNEKIKDRVVKDLSSFLLASHYGCHYLKPSDIYDYFDDPENPKSLDTLIRATGAQIVEYEDKKGCCGNVILGVDEDISLAIAKQKLDHVSLSGPGALVLLCPACGLQLDNFQRKIEVNFGADYKLPILYYPQLLGLALGRKPEELGLDMNRVSVDELLKKVMNKQKNEGKH